MNLFLLIFLLLATFAVRIKAEKEQALSLGAQYKHASLRSVAVNSSLPTTLNKETNIVAVASTEMVMASVNEDAEYVLFCTVGQMCVCPAPYYNQIGGCVSDESPRCKDSGGHTHEGAIICKGYNTLFPTTTFDMANYAPETGGKWMCGNSGTTFNCPSNQRAIGECSSSNPAECGLYCQPKAVTAEYCSPPSDTSPYQLSTKECRWLSGKDGSMVRCSGTEVVAGTCLSGKDPACSNHSGRWKCCEMLDCTPANVTGYWEVVGSGMGPGSSITVEIGVSVTNTEQMAKGTIASVETTMTKGFTFADSIVYFDKSVSVTGKVAAMEVSMVSQSLTKSVTVTTVASCSLPGNWVQWQFRYAITGSCPSTVYQNAFMCTTSVASPPCCLPGYNSDALPYGECVDNSPNICK